MKKTLSTVLFLLSVLPSFAYPRDDTDSGTSGITLIIVIVLFIIGAMNAKKDKNGNLTESKERTGLWAWKHPHSADGSVTYTELKGDVVLDSVDFEYEEGKRVLHDVSLYAKPGQKVAFVGATGAGKTTITNLINRFYDIADGKIRYDGININKIKKSNKSSKILTHTAIYHTNIKHCSTFRTKNSTKFTPEC